MIPRFFLAPEQIQGSSARFLADDSHHLRTVLKARTGDPLVVLDGEGLEYAGRLTEIGKTTALAALQPPTRPQTEAQVRVTVAQGLPRMAHKLEQVLEHGTEAGAAAFWNFASTRSALHLEGDRQRKRESRWAGIIKTAAEQSHRALLPTLRVLDDFGSVLASAADFDLALLADPEAVENVRAILATCSPSNILVVVGPESGFTDSEIAAARRAGLRPLSLGPRVLRTETAALVAVASLLCLLE